MNRIIEEDIMEIAKKDLQWERLKNRTVLITGANGHLPSYMIYVLMYRNDYYNDGVKIYALCRNREKAEALFSNYLQRSDFKLIIQDVCDDISDEYRADYIIHAASPANHYAFEKETKNIIQANVFGFNNILNKAVKWGTSRIILFSSCAVYGTIEGKEGVDEEYRGCLDFTDYRQCFGISKQMCEMMAQVYRKQYHMDICVLRPTLIYGPGGGYSQRRCITDFVRNYVENEDIVLKSDGQTVRSFLYIKDATEGFLRVLLSGENGEAYNISTEKNICSVKELAELFTTYEKKLEVKFDRSIMNQADGQYLKSVISSMRQKNGKLRKLGWNESTDLRTGIWRTIEWAESTEHFIDV